MGKVSSTNPSPSISKESSAKETPSTGGLTLTPVKRLHDGSIKSHKNFRATLSQNSQDSTSTEYNQPVVPSQSCSTDISKNQSLSNNSDKSSQAKTPHSSPTQNFQNNKLLQFTSTNSPTEKFLLKHTPKKLKITKSLDSSSPYKCESVEPSQASPVNSSAEKSLLKNTLDMSLNENSPDNLNKKSPVNSNKKSSESSTNLTSGECLKAKNSSSVSIQQSQSIKISRTLTVESSRKKSLSQSSWKSSAINRNYLEVFSRGPTIILENLIHTNLLSIEQRNKLRLLAETNKKKKPRNLSYTGSSRSDDFNDSSNSFHINEKTLRSLPARDERLKLERDSRRLSWEQTSNLSEYDCPQQLKSFLSIDDSEQKLDITNKLPTRNFHGTQIVTSVYQDKDEEKKWRAWNLESSSSSDEGKPQNYQAISQNSSLSVCLISSDELVIDETPKRKKSKKKKSLLVKKQRGRKPSTNKQSTMKTQKLASNIKVVDPVEESPELSFNPLIKLQTPQLPAWKILNITRVLETFCNDVRICLKMNIRTESEARRSGLFDEIVKNRKDRNPLNHLPKKKIIRKPGKKSAKIKKNSELSVTKQKYAAKNASVKKMKVESDGNTYLDDDDDDVNEADLVVKKMPSMPAIENIGLNQQNAMEESKVEIKMEADHQINPDLSIDVDQNVIKHETASICDLSNDVSKTNLLTNDRKLTDKRKYPEIIHDTILPAGRVSLVSSVTNERYLPKINCKIMDNKTPNIELANKKSKSKDLNAEMRDDRLKRAFENWSKIPELNNLISPSNSVVNECTQNMDKKSIENLDNKFTVSEQLSKTTQKERKKIVYNVIDDTEKKPVAPLTLKNVETFTSIVRNRRQSHLPEMSKPATRIRTRISPPTSKTNQQSFKNEPSSSMSRSRRGRRDWKKESLDGESNSSTETSPEPNTLKRTSSDESLPKFGKSVTIQNNDTLNEPLVRRVLEWVNTSPKTDDKNFEELNLSDDSSYCSSKKSKTKKTENIPTIGSNSNFNLPTVSHIDEETQSVIDKDEGIVSQTSKLIDSKRSVDKCDDEDNGDNNFIKALNDSFEEEEELLYGISQSFGNENGKSVDKVEINTDKTVQRVGKVNSGIGKDSCDVDKVENPIIEDVLVGNQNGMDVNNKLGDENNDDSLSVSSSSSDSSSSTSSSSSSVQSRGSNEAPSSGFIEATQCSSKSNLQSTCENNKTGITNEVSSQRLVINDDTIIHRSTVLNTYADNRLVIDEDINNDDDMADTEGNLVIDDDNIEVKADSDENDSIQEKKELVTVKLDDESDDMDALDFDRISLYAESTLLFDYDLKNDKSTCSSPKPSSFGENPNPITPKKIFNYYPPKLGSPQGLYNRMESDIFDNYRELTAKDFDNDYTNITVQNGSITTQKFRNRQLQYNARVSNSATNNGPVVPSYARSPNHNNNNNDVNLNNFNMFNHSSNNINSFVSNHKLQLDLNSVHQKPKFVIDPLVVINNPIRDYVKTFFNGNCFNYLKTGNCDRNNCRHPHEMKPRILHMHMELPHYINKMLIYGFEHKFHHYLRFVYLKAIQRLDPAEIFNFFSIIFYVQNRQWVVEYLGWTIDTLIIKNRTLISIVNYLRDRIIEMGNMIKPPMTPGEMFWLIINQLTPRIESGTYWETFQPLILSQLTLPAIIVDIILQECIEYNKPYAHIKDVHSTLILGLRDNIFGQGNPVLFSNFMALLENYEKMEVLTNVDSIIDKQFAIEIRQKPQETISLASPDGSGTNLIADNLEPTNSTIVNKYIPERDLIQPKLTPLEDVVVTSSINVPKLPEKQPTSTPLDVLNNQKPENGEILFDNKHKLIKIDVNNPKSVHEHYIWLFRADLENIQAAMKKNDYDEIIKILNINKRSQLQLFVRGFYRILCGEIIESARHLTEIIQRTGNNYFNKSPTGEIQINYEH